MNWFELLLLFIFVLCMIVGLAATLIPSVQRYINKDILK